MELWLLRGVMTTVNAMSIAGRTLWPWLQEVSTPWDCAVMELWLLRGGITTVNAMSATGKISVFRRR